MPKKKYNPVDHLPKNPDGTVKAGPGRPKGSVSGRRQVIEGLDKLLAKTENQERLMKALEREFNRAPVKFFKEIVMKLLPKQAMVQVDASVTQFTSILDAIVQDEIKEVVDAEFEVKEDGSEPRADSDTGSL